MAWTVASIGARPSRTEMMVAFLCPAPPALSANWLRQASNFMSPEVLKLKAFAEDEPDEPEPCDPEGAGAGGFPDGADGVSVSHEAASSAAARPASAQRKDRRDIGSA